MPKGECFVVTKMLLWLGKTRISSVYSPLPFPKLAWGSRITKTRVNTYKVASKHQWFRWMSRCLNPLSLNPCFFWPLTRSLTLLTKKVHSKTCWKRDRPEVKGKNKWFLPWKQVYHTHRIHVWYIYLHLVDFYGKCRQIYHTWILWDR